MTKRGSDVRVGEPLPLGVRPRRHGVNFSVFSRHATGVILEFYARPEDAAPSQRIVLDPQTHRTGDVWHVWVAGLEPGQLYGYRAEGPYRPQEGHRFNPNRLLLDPCATAMAPIAEWRFADALGYDPDAAEKDLSFSTVDDAAAMRKAVFTDEAFEWDGDEPLRIPWSDTVIYETHVRGLTVRAGSEVEHPGTYLGVVEKLPYLRDLGVTALELMPVFEFNEHELDRRDPRSGRRLRNYWGYNPVGFFAPKASYAAVPAAPVREFKTLVKACHRAGIEVFLDVVFNHTAEGNELGPTLSFRGLDNAIYYQLSDDRRYYRDDTGTGNTLNANHPVVRDLILQALRYWVIEMHVDGFRFDLASVLGRDEDGRLLADAPLLERIAEDPILRETKLIAEAWDAAGAYQVGSFSKRRWAEWNGRYRDDVRRFWRGDPGMLGAFASRLCGSADVYQGSGKGPESSVNFVTCHDGFTLNDLVSYARKHNEENGESNRDGTDENWSANYGVEGETGDPAVQAVRARQVKNLLLSLFISRGVPMLLGGDEFRRTQNGNNNAYCQDNETSWFDWTLLEAHRSLYRFVRGAIALRRAHPVLCKEAFYTPEEIRFFSPDGGEPDWSDPQARALGCVICGEGSDELCLLFNAGEDAVRFSVPAARSGCWRRAFDTAALPASDRPAPEETRSLEDPEGRLVESRSTVVLTVGP
jgi:isoamylase